MPPSMLIAISGRVWFHCAHKGAHEFSVDLRRDGIYIDAFLCQKFARVLDFVHTCWFDADLIEARSGELGAVVVFIERSGNAADPEEGIFPQVIGNLRRV